MVAATVSWGIVIPGPEAARDAGMKRFRGETWVEAARRGGDGNARDTTAGAEVMAGAQAALRRDLRAAPAGPVRRRPGPGRAADRGGGRALPGLLQEPGHRRDDAAAGGAGRGVRR